MTTLDRPALEAAICALPEAYKGPGGTVAVVQNGKLVTSQVWGYADMQNRVPMSSTTMMPICSVTKQFTCAVLMELFDDLSELDAKLGDFLPDFAEPLPRIVDLCNNQSGFRDYWALTVICGADPEGLFTDDDARKLLGKMRSSHFPAGSQYSYNNGNFRLLSLLIEQETGRSLIDLMREKLFQPAQMPTAGLYPDTSITPGGAVGYEGNISFGFIPAKNAIHWNGDAGICASLNDMIAWEQYIDATREDAEGIYRRLAVPQTFADGKPAFYGYGLKHHTIGDVAISGHGGALRGWRCQRFYAASERLSVIVMFNHQASAYAAAEQVMRAALGQGKPAQPAITLTVDPAWYGNYFDPQSQLSLSLSPAISGQVHARFATSPELMSLQADGSLQSSVMTLRRDGEKISLIRAEENLTAVLHPVQGDGRIDIEGSYHCDEMDADFVCSVQGNAVFAAFEGFLGQGPMQPLYAIAEDIWLLPCQRGMDAPAPGEWTVVAIRDQQGTITGLTIGCWLARGLTYRKI